MFSCEFYKISKNTFSYRKSPVAASVDNWETKNLPIFWKELLLNAVNDSMPIKYLVYWQPLESGKTIVILVYFLMTSWKNILVYVKSNWDKDFWENRLPNLSNNHVFCQGEIFYKNPNQIRITWSHFYQSFTHDKFNDESCVIVSGWSKKSALFSVWSQFLLLFGKFFYQTLAEWWRSSTSNLIQIETLLVVCP